jgi:hypothetical protein
MQTECFLKDNAEFSELFVFFSGTKILQGRGGQIFRIRVVADFATP